MKKICAILLISLLCCGLMCGCGEEPAETPADYDYSDLTEPVVDLKITDCITEQQLTAILGYSMLPPQIGESDTQAIYQSEDGACMVSISLKNQTRGVFDSDIAALSDTVTLYEGVGEVAYLSNVTGELLVYQSGYSLGVAVSIPETENGEPQTRQIAELMITALQPAA